MSARRGIGFPTGSTSPCFRVGRVAVIVRIVPQDQGGGRACGDAAPGERDLVNGFATGNHIELIEPDEVVPTRAEAAFPVAIVAFFQSRLGGELGVPTPVNSFINTTLKFHQEGRSA